MKHLLLISVLWLMTVEKSLAIKCYECQSINDTRCNDFFNVPFPEAVVDCDLRKNPMGLRYKASFCRKIKQKSKCHIRMRILFQLKLIKKKNNFSLWSREDNKIVWIYKVKQHEKLHNFIID